MSLTQPVTNLSYSYHYDEPYCFSKIEETIYQLLMEVEDIFSREIIYVCIGTDRATGDCLGPLTGSKLKSYLASAHIYGTLEEPVHAVNLSSTLLHIKENFSRPLIIAVDASLGNKDRIGYINIRKGAIKPGTALKKDLPEVGDFHISGVVNVGGFLEHMVLQNTRLYTVYRMAETIAQGLYLFHHRFTRKSAKRGR
ncbi:putative sporulation protein YyaC [Thermosyntropha lipolytica DSM 11003]|uniref:Putative sporulation protein YyaC n=1 Tax=Thermosyntropha lipolytica DSM 11003 TaxID=1123382 RepID=A0A1M5QWG2_9FIRM|nr:spore protease YyaC [Thermosyntropha lipolytica]SHH18049.1 putative sporulation protein YyaC [Thermosyntropha lipolytica DSM 11003]